MLAGLAWIPRGKARTKLPNRIQVEDGMETSDNDEQQLENQKQAVANSEESQPNEEPSPTADLEEVLANDLDNLSFYKKGEKDPYLSSNPKANDLFDEEELEDLTIRPTDAVIVSVHSGDDVSLLMTHVFDDNPDESDDEDGRYVPHTYIHHDIVVPALPLCAAHTTLQVNGDGANLVAVGMFTPGIEIWDVDQVNNLEPVVSLGGYGDTAGVKTALSAAHRVRKGEGRQRNKKPRLKLREGSHKDAVMSLSWNSVQREYLASGSADETVKVWDIESAHCASTFSHHNGKVQSVSFHPSEAELLLTGSFDKSVHILDLRSQESKSVWAVEADIETCSWGHGPTEGLVFATTEDGFISVFDTRMSKTKSSCLVKWQAHSAAVSACSISQDIPGLMVTGSVDKTIKVWDVSRSIMMSGGELIYERPSKVGAVFALSLCPLPDSKTNASPFVIALGGSKNSLVVSDIGVESKAVRDRFLSHCGALSAAFIKKRSERTAGRTKSSPMETYGKGEQINASGHSESSDSSVSEETEDL